MHGLCPFTPYGCEPQSIHPPEYKGFGCVKTEIAQALTLVCTSFLINFFSPFTCCYIYSYNCSSDYQILVFLLHLLVDIS